MKEPMEREGPGPETSAERGPRRYATPGDDGQYRAADDRSVGSLIRELGEESTRLVRQEVALAKAEIREKIQVYERNAVKIAIGGVLLLGAALVLIVALNRGVTVLFAQFMDLELAVWIAPLLLAAVIGLIGWSMVKGGKEAIANEPIAPEKTTAVIKEEKQWIANELK